MTAFEAAQISAKAQALADMPVVYKQIKEAAETGKRDLFLSKREVKEVQLNILREKGYKIAEEWVENNSQSSDILEGWLLSW